MDPPPDAVAPLHVRMGSPIVGGPDRVLAALATLPPALDLAVIDDGRTDRELLARTFASSGARLHWVPTRGRFDPRAPIRLARLARSLAAQVLHTWDYKADVVGWGAARLASLPLVCSLHGLGGGGGRLRLYGAVDRWVLRRADAVLAVSRALARATAGDRAVVVPNVVGVEPTPPRRLVAHPRRLVFVGRLAPVKGLDGLLSALALARREVPDLTLILVGDGPEAGVLAGRTADLGLAEVVEFTGWLEDPTPVLDACDLLVLPSLHEEQPVALLEAMARGMPAVVTDVGENRALVEAPATGLVVPPGDADALAAALVEASKLRFDGERAWSKVHAGHTPRHLADIHLAVYRRLTAARSRAASGAPT